MRKVLIALILAVVIAFSGCDVVNIALEVLEYALEQSDEADQTTETGETIEIPQPNDSQTIKAKDEPKLPDMDFSQTDFFKDGYEKVTYIRTTDGDTASFDMNGVNVKCRFVGINTPEVAHNGEPAEAYGEAAKSFTADTLSNAYTIVLERDDAAGTYDKYDRLLAWVWVDGKLLAAQLVDEGLANTRYLRTNYKYAEYIIEIEDSAKKRNVGIWE